MDGRLTAESSNPSNIQNQLPPVGGVPFNGPVAPGFQSPPGRRHPRPPITPGPNGAVRGDGADAQSDQPGVMQFAPRANSLMDAALHYASLGWRVMPLHGITEFGGKFRCTCKCGPACK